MASASERVRAITGSTSGAGCRTQRTATAKIRTAAAANRPITLPPLQPQSGPLTSASVNAPIPAVNRPAPTRSGRSPSTSLTSRSSRAETTIAAIPIGTLTTNTHRQPACTSSPPIGGPAAAATPPTAAQMPTAAARFSGGYSGSSRPSEVGNIAAAPTPCATRAATRTGTDGAAAHAAEASVNSPIPETNARLRPARSAHRPSGTSSAA